MRIVAGAAVAVLILAATAQAKEAAAAPDTAGLRELAPADLFVRASSSALQFEPLREPSRRLLVRRYEESLPYLTTCLDTDDARERHALRDILVRIGEPAVGPLIDALAAESKNAQTSRGTRLAAEILGRLGDVRALEPLARLQTHSDWKVRAAVAEALGRISGAQAISPLAGLLSDGNEVVRKSAAVGLARVAESSASDLGNEARRALSAALADPYYAVRYGARRALAACGQRALKDLLDAAENAPAPTRQVAILAIGEIGSPRALRTLRALARSEDWLTRAYAFEALGRIGTRGRDRRLLESGASDTHPFVALKAREALRGTDR